MTSHRVNLAAVYGALVSLCNSSITHSILPTKLASRCYWYGWEIFFESRHHWRKLIIEEDTTTSPGEEDLYIKDCEPVHEEDELLEADDRHVSEENCSSAVT